MSTEQNKTNTCRSLEDGFNQQSLALVEEFAAASYVSHTPIRETQNLAAYKQFLATFFSAFPDLGFTSDELRADGDQTVPATEASIAMRWVQDHTCCMVSLCVST